MEKIKKIGIKTIAIVTITLLILSIACATIAINIKSAKADDVIINSEYYGNIEDISYVGNLWAETLDPNNGIGQNWYPTYNAYLPRIESNDRNYSTTNITIPQGAYYLIKQVSNELSVNQISSGITVKDAYIISSYANTGNIVINSFSTMNINGAWDINIADIRGRRFNMRYLLQKKYSNNKNLIQMGDIYGFDGQVVTTNILDIAPSAIERIRIIHEFKLNENNVGVYQAVFSDNITNLANTINYEIRSNNQITYDQEDIYFDVTINGSDYTSALYPNAVPLTAVYRIAGFGKYQPLPISRYEGQKWGVTQNNIVKWVEYNTNVTAESSYNSGYNAGISEIEAINAQEKQQIANEAWQQGYNYYDDNTMPVIADNEYQRGKRAGYLDGIESANTNTWSNLFSAIFDTPVKILFGKWDATRQERVGGLFNLKIPLGDQTIDFEILITGLMSIAIVAVVIKIVIKIFL